MSVTFLMHTPAKSPRWQGAGADEAAGVQVEFIRITVGKDEVLRPATAADRAKYADAYAAFKSASLPPDALPPLKTPDPAAPNPAAMDRSLDLSGQPPFVPSKPLDLTPKKPAPKKGR